MSAQLDHLNAQRRARDLPPITRSEATDALVWMPAITVWRLLPSLPPEEVHFLTYEEMPAAPTPEPDNATPSDALGWRSTSAFATLALALKMGRRMSRMNHVVRLDITVEAAIVGRLNRKKTHWDLYGHPKDLLALVVPPAVELGAK